MIRFAMSFALVSLAACAAKPKHDESARTPSAVTATDAVAAKKAEAKSSSCQNGLVLIGR